MFAESVAGATRQTVESALSASAKPPQGNQTLGESVRRGTLDSIFEAPNSFGQPLSKLRQLLRAEHQEGNCKNNYQMPRLEQIFNHKRFLQFSIAPCAAPPKKIKAARGPIWGIGEPTRRALLRGGAALRSRRWYPRLPRGSPNRRLDARSARWRPGESVIPRIAPGPALLSSTPLTIDKSQVGAYK